MGWGQSKGLDPMGKGLNLWALPSWKNQVEPSLTGQQGFNLWVGLPQRPKGHIWDPESGVKRPRLGSLTILGCLA